MNKINVTPEKIVITYNRKVPIFKKVFSKEKEVLLKNIKFITKEDYKGNFRALAILKKRGDSLYLAYDKFDDLEEAYTLLMKYHTKENNYQISVIDVDKMQETKII